LIGNGSLISITYLFWLVDLNTCVVKHEDELTGLGGSERLRVHLSAQPRSDVDFVSSPRTLPHEDDRSVDAVLRQLPPVPLRVLPSVHAKPPLVRVATGDQQLLAGAATVSVRHDGRGLHPRAAAAAAAAPHRKGGQAGVTAAKSPAPFSASRHATASEKT